MLEIELLQNTTVVKKNKNRAQNGLFPFWKFGK